VIEGTVAAPSVAVIVTFPDRDAAKAWINDPELSEVHALREGSGVSNIILCGFVKPYASRLISTVCG
jgi:uncharacterized protein (DUF1330 family)